MDTPLREAVRAILYRERGKATLSNVIATLRHQGWKKLGAVEDFETWCIEQGFHIEHHYKDAAKTIRTRTFVTLPEKEAA